jgi:transcriptional regulator with XRE-family HTH domain
VDPLLLSPLDLAAAVGRRAKERRLALGLRQVDLAAQAGLSLATLKRFENHGEGSFESVVRLAFALHAEREFGALFPPHDPRSLDEILAANRSRKRARR